MPHDHLVLTTSYVNDPKLAIQKATLEAAQIDCYLHQEPSGVGYPFGLPQGMVVLVHREDYAKALEVLEDLALELAAPATAPGRDWRCEKCGEGLGANFTSCWNCGAERDEW